MNDEMDDFASKMGVPNMYGLIQGPANSIAPGKRPLSAMTPTIVLTRRSLFHRRRLRLVLGTPGGSTIITTVANDLISVLDNGLNIQQSADAPRFHHQYLPGSPRSRAHLSQRHRRPARRTRLSHQSPDGRRRTLPRHLGRLRTHCRPTHTPTSCSAATTSAALTAKPPATKPPPTQVAAPKPFQTHSRPIPEPPRCHPAAAPSPPHPQTSLVRGRAATVSFIASDSPVQTATPVQAAASAACAPLANKDCCTIVRKYLTSSSPAARLTPSFTVQSYVPRVP